MGGSSAPSPDPRAGLAALKSAETGQQALEFMKSQAGITNEWAETDRKRFTDKFLPMQDQFIRDAQGWSSPARKAAAASEASAEVGVAARLGKQQNQRRMMSMGVNPNSGNAMALERRATSDTALASAGAVNLSGRRIEAEADAKMANAINLGSGLAVNPGTSMGLSNSAGQAGFGAAMQGYGQQANILNQDYQNRRAAHEDKNAGMAGLMGAVGQVAGAYAPQLFTMLSSKDAKTNKKAIKPGDNLKALGAMPVESWDYKPGMGDGGSHVGAYAEDFHKATGKGDGKSINVIDAIGVTMGAVKDLDAKVSQMLKGKQPNRPTKQKVAA